LLSTVVDTGPNPPPTGSLRFFQPTIFSDVSVTGVITGLAPHESINVHVRARGDVTANCANQGDQYNPKLVSRCTVKAPNFGPHGNFGPLFQKGFVTIKCPCHHLLIHARIMHSQL
jgi:hypothetical protein